MGPLIAFLYGIASYVVFFVTFLYAVGFVTGVVVPKTIDTGVLVPTSRGIGGQPPPDDRLRASSIV